LPVHLESGYAGLRAARRQVAILFICPLTKQNNMGYPNSVKRITNRLGTYNRPLKRITVRFQLLAYHSFGRTNCF